MALWTACQHFDEINRGLRPPTLQGRTKIDNMQLKEARQKLGLTQKQLADLIESDPLSMRRMEMDPKHSTARKMPPRVWRLICAYLDGWRPADWPETTRKD